MQQTQGVSQEEAQEGNVSSNQQEQQITLPNGHQLRIVNASLLPQIQQQTMQQQQESVSQQLQPAQQLIESNALVKRESVSTPPVSPQNNINGQLMTLQQLQSFLPPHMQLTAATATPAPVVDGVQHASRDIKPTLVSLQNVPNQFIQV